MNNPVKSNIAAELVNELVLQSDQVFRFVRRIVPDRDIAYDITQDTMLKVLNRSSSNTGIANLKGYIFKTAYNTAINFRRDMIRRKVKEEQIEELNFSVAAQSDRGIETEETATMLAKSLETLADKQRQVILLRFYGEMPLKEIASSLRISVGSVKVHLARGLKNMKKVMLVKTIKE